MSDSAGAPDRDAIAARETRPLAVSASASGIALLLLAAIAIIFYNEESYRDAKLQQLAAQSRILASTVAAALVFDDRKAAQEYVGALSVDPQILAAAVYDARGALFASFAQSGRDPPPRELGPARAATPSDELSMSAAVEQNGAKLGEVVVQSALEPISTRLARYGVIGLLIVMAAAMFAVLATSQKRLGAANARLRDQRLGLERANEALNAQIEQREKAEEALRQAQKVEAIGQLTGGIAHDFNNLLQVVIGSLEVLQRGKLVRDEQGIRFVAAAVRSAKRAAVLTQQLLAFARRQPLNPQPIDVNRLIAGMSELLHRTLGESVTIETVLGSGLWRVSADANQLENALINLALNARDAMQPGGKLTIETANARLDEAYARDNDAQAGQYAMIAVSDTGTGMTKDVLSKAFEPFFTTKEHGKGSGLGLSQVYGFAKQSGGHAKIYSEVGAGTTIRLYLPRLQGSDDAPERHAALDSVPQGTPDQVVLVVEDDEQVRTHTVALLRELGYTVLEADGGASALRALESDRRVRLLFTDVGLPGGMNGRQLADDALRRWPSLRVLFMTGYARDAIVHQGRLDPGIELITKPFTYAALAERVAQMFA